ncbi:MAG: peptidase S1, partial [Terriglobales bacterium]
AGTFYYVSNRRPAAPTQAHTSWTNPAKLEITEAAAPQSFDSEEQNNISVYRKVLPAVVNITSRAVTFDFF